MATEKEVPIALFLLKQSGQFQKLLLLFPLVLLFFGLKSSLPTQVVLGMHQPRISKFVSHLLSFSSMMASPTSLQRIHLHFWA